MGLAAPQQQSDIEFAADFLALNALIEACVNGEKVALLLSTCRNAYLTINAMFVDLQILLSGEGQSLRGAAELLARGEVKRAAELFGRAAQTLAQADAKKDVWDKRHALWEQAQATLSTLAGSDPLIENRVLSMIGSVRSPDGQLLGGWHDETLSFDLADRPHLDRHAAAVGRVVEILRACIVLGRLYAVDESAKLQGSLEFLQPTHADAATSPGLGVAAAALADLCEWRVQEEGGQILVEIYGMRPVRSAPQTTELSLPSRMSAEGAGLVHAEVGLMIREAMYRCHDDLTAIFKPNVAQRPMSDPFVVQLPAPSRASTSGTTRELEVARVRCRTSDGPRDHARLAIASLAVPEAALDDYRIAEEVSGKVMRDARLAIREAARADCQAIVFPEYSLPHALAGEALKLADDHRIVIVGGMEGEWKGSQLVDKALVAVPGESRLHHQLKQEPSLYEEAGAAFHSDNVMRLFSGTPIGDFAVTVCSDWLETATMRVWTPESAMPEVHIVVARNGYTDLYRSFAIADSMRLYAAVVVANVCEGQAVPGEAEGRVSTNDGSGVFVPRARLPALEAERVPVDGDFCRSLSIFDIDLRAIRARSRGKPEPGYLAVPKSAQRTLGERR